MRRTLRWLLFGLPPLLGLSPLALAQRPHGPVTWTFSFQDDKLFLSDNQYTGGGGVSMHSAIASRLSQTHGTPAFGKSLARWVLPTGPQLGYRESWTLGQVQDTPTHLGTHRLITNDFPYMGLLGWGNTFIAFNDRNLYGAELMLGLVGPLAGGKQVQTAIHSIMSTPPHGWNNQLDNEPVINLYYTFQHKIWRAPHFDIASSLDAALGNYFTYGQTGLIARIGQLPPGFATLPDPLGRGVNYDATQTPTDRGYFYATVAVRGTGVGRSMERQGNLIRNDNPWTQRNTLHMRPFVAQLIAGVNYVRPRWGVHFDMWMTTNTVDTDNLPPASDAHNNFGAVWFDYRFN
ncbi:lipid A deacylase LpxR family protein [Salinisphaera sp. LB1]|uniref:lipid A deacylase LpxR family protein n=1 Tax=Salinisphaera sp. LB1 TaxID=2183911 RepID=UPI000D7DFF22|nr:lipid A deacylase LpxR family protein [Salinisphaera sp. LB1]AWN16212.1 putative outer membrane protein [Salinisphaera sp. LB1]